jgi:hypothetical protein
MSDKNKIKLVLDKLLIQDQALKTQVENYLIKEYAKRDQNFTETSPYGQILKVIEELNKLQYFYLEDALNERSTETAFKQKSIRGLARLTGHNPYRSISAKGEISLKIKPGAANDISSSNIEINNFTKLICQNNSLTYLIKLNSDSVLIPKNSQEFIYFNIIQGETGEETFQSDGTPLQSFTLDNRTQVLENDNVKVFVNGQEYKNFESLYDMNKGDLGVIVKTGINGQVDVYFGNQDYGTIPALGQVITVKFLKTAGQGGNLGISENQIIFEFDGEATLGDGQVVDLNEIFDIRITKKITLGSDGENTDLTKHLLNKNSRALVLANPDNYVHFLRRYSQFSFIYAFNTFGDEYLDDDNVVYVFLMPDITKKVSSNSDYFSTNIDNFYIDTQTKDAVYKAINTSGSQFISAEMKIIDPVVKRFAMNIYLRVFDDIISEETIEAEIVNKVGEYFLNLERRDKIPRSDLIKVIEEIDGVDSVSLSFISEENENAIRNGFYYKEISYNNKQTSDILLTQLRNNSQNTLDINTSTDVTQTQKIIVNLGQDPRLGLDEFGDIIIGNKELPIMRGGFFDRRGVEYKDGIDPLNLSAVNVIFKESIPRFTKYKA